MRNPKLHNLGMLFAIIGIIIVAGGVYMGSAPQFHTTLSDQSSTIFIGLVPLIGGGLMWLFFDE